ncbi:MAG: recombinase family protein, partial [Oribacterium sp.]|nr:recombinase family protein [Oribacterium sp.]
MSDFAYCRVSTKDQNLDRQTEAMKKAGILPEHIICEKESGRDMNRPIWLRLKHRMRSGDTLTIMSIDRLGRNYDEI